jgi:hypothetical protein
MKQHKGGSVASDTVSGLVNAGTYNSMSKTFSNDFCGGRKKPVKKETKPIIVKKAHAHKGGDGGEFGLLNSAMSALSIKPFSPVTSPFASRPAPLELSTVLPRNVGVQQTAPTKATTGGNAQAKQPKQTKRGGSMPATLQNIKTMSQLMERDASIYSLRNKRGGAAATPQSLGLNYSAVAHTGHTNGYNINRALASTEVPNRILAAEPAFTAAPLQKTVQYGATTDSKTAFSYWNPQTVTSETVKSTAGGAPKSKQSKLTKLKKLAQRTRSVLKKAKAHK